MRVAVAVAVMIDGVVMVGEDGGCKRCPDLDCKLQSGTAA